MDWLRRYLSALPIVVTNYNLVNFELSTFAHFIDVSNSHCEHDAAGGNYNRNEAYVIQGLVLALLATGKAHVSLITIIVGYRKQLRFLQKLGLQHPWSGVTMIHGANLMTVRLAQGREGRIVFTGLTQTTGVFAQR